MGSFILHVNCTSGSSRFVSIIFFGLLLTALDAAGLCAAAEPAITVAALSAQTQVVVVVNAEGREQRLSPGDRVTGSEWRVQRVLPGQVLLRSSRILSGHPVVVRLAVGQRFDLGQFDRDKARSKTSVLVPSAISIHGIKRRAVPRR